MSVKLADTLAPMGDFAIGESKDIDIEINGINKRLQQAYEDGDLGGGGSSIQVDTMPIASAENENMIVQYVGASGTYQNGYFYQNIGSGDPKVYSWVQKNVQPSNATATDVSYDNTTSELIATNVQDAIDEIKGGLGTASGKNFTDLVRPNSHELVESGSVYSAINNALSSIYTPRGELTCAELTSSLLIEDNVGNIYTMSDSGTTSALFINGAGQTINVNNNVGIIKAGANTYLFNLMGDAFDLHDYQKKELSSGAMIEDVIPSNASVSNKLVAKSEIDLRVDLTGNIDLNEYYANGKYIARNGTEYTVTNAPSDLPYPNNGFSLEVMSYGASDGNTDAFCTQILTAYTSDRVWIRSRFWGSDWFRWTNWQKLATSDDMTSLLKNKMSCYTWGTDKTLKAVFYEITDRGILPDVNDAVGKRIIARYGNVLINRITQVNGIKNLYWNDTLVLSCPWNDDTTKLTDVLEIFVGTTAWQKLAPANGTLNPISSLSDANSATAGSSIKYAVSSNTTSNLPTDISVLYGLLEISQNSVGNALVQTLTAIYYGTNNEALTASYHRSAYFNGNNWMWSAWERFAVKSDLPTSGVGTGVNKQDIVSGDANTTINIPAYHFCSGFMYLSISGIGTALLSYDIDFDRNLTLKMIAGTGMSLTGLTLYKGQTPLGAFSANGDYIVFSAQYYTIIRTNYASL